MPTPASSNPCLPCGDCPLTRTPAACASPGTQRGFCLEATCGTNLSFSATATRNPLTLKIKRELCNLTLKGSCPPSFLRRQPLPLPLFLVRSQKQQKEGHGCQLLSQTHCFPPGSHPPVLLRDFSGTICKGLPLDTVLIYLAHRTSIPSRSHCSDLGAMTIQNEAAKCLNSHTCISGAVDDKGHVKSPMETTNQGETQGVVCHCRVTRRYSFRRGPGKPPLIYNGRLFSRQFSGRGPDFS